MLETERPSSQLAEPPLITRDTSLALPSTWCVVACEQGCDQSWTVDVADFAPPLNAGQVEDLLEPLLIAHEIEHGKRW